jgi:subtilisin family serine protease
MKRTIHILLVTTLLVLCLATPAAADGAKTMIGINVVLNTSITDAILADLNTHGNVRDVVYEINALTMRIRQGDLGSIRALSYVAAANPDAERNAAPVDIVSVTNFENGMNTWDLDAINVTDFNEGRTIQYNGSGVYVAVLDTGLVDIWRAYFPQERIAEEYAISLSGGGAMDAGVVADQPNKWEHDQDSHGTHVTSTILGYSLRGKAVNGVAPMATVIPVKVLNQNGSGWSSVIARGIIYVADLKIGLLANYPVVINMSLGGPSLDAMEKAAIDYAVSHGVIIVASAGNAGDAGMGYPGAYAPVISVAASGWINEWTLTSSGLPWWNGLDVADPIDPADFYIGDFSSRELSGQDLDVAAPGTWIVGPYKTNSGMSLSYFYLGGTSMASPHVAGIVALMAQKDPLLTASQAEGYLESSAVYLAPGCRTVLQPSGNQEFCWGANATGAGLVDAAAVLGVTP